MDSAKQPVMCSHHTVVQIVEMSKARVNIMSCTIPELCNLCAEGALGGAGTKDTHGRGKEEVKEEALVVEEVENKEMEQKNTNKKKRKKKKKKQQQQEDHLWVCLECEKYFCGGAGPVPNGHMMKHWKQSHHGWVLNFKDPTMMYCFRCKKDVSMRIPAAPKLMPFERLEIEPKPLESWDGDSKGIMETKPLEPSNWDDWEPDWDSDSKGSTEPKPLQPTQPSSSRNSSCSSDSKEGSPPVHPKDDSAISGSSENLTETDTCITSCRNFIWGLKNIGNTCFFNVIVQNLLALDSLRCKFIGTHIGTGPLTVSLQQLFVQTSSPNNKGVVLNPKKLVTTVCTNWPQFVEGKMDDAGELLLRFLDVLKQEEVAAPKLLEGSSNTSLYSIFAGKERTTVSSKKGCNHGSTRDEDTSVYQLSLPCRRLPPNRAHDTTNDSSTLVSLKDCFSLYTEEEEIAGWVCVECTEEAKSKISQTNPLVEANQIEVHRTVDRRLLITEAPKVLVVAFKRYNESEKIEGHVHFEEFFDLGPFMDQSCNQTENKYRLVGVAEHDGNPTGGHYVAYIRGNKMTGDDTKTWFSASDGYIKESHLQEVLGCEAYIVFYERCPIDAFHSSDSDPWPQRGDPLSVPIPPPLDYNSWEKQRSKHRDRRREQDIAMKEASLLPQFWVFLDLFTRCGDDIPHYRFLLAAMLKMGSRLGQLDISYLDLVSHSKELAMGISNGYARLQVFLMETAREYVHELAKMLGVTESSRMQQLQLNFHGMPKTHEELKECLKTPLLRKMDVFGHTGDQIMVPLPQKCALVQRLIKHVVGHHRSGYSWEGGFDIDDVELFDGEVVISKTPTLFEINPISSKMVDAMQKDFNVIAKVIKKFSFSGAYVPYKKSFITLLSCLSSFADWWLKPATAELLRQWIENFLFLKAPMARSNLIVGIFTSYRSYDDGDTSQQLKVVLQKVFDLWTANVKQTVNVMVEKVFKHKNSYRDELNFMFELLRHLSLHGTHKTFDMAAFPGAPPCTQLVKLLDELEIAGAFDLEDAVFNGLCVLLKESEMRGMLKTIWECYLFCNYPYEQ